MSAHHYFRDFAYCDSGMIPWLLIASLVSSTGKSLAAMVEDRMAAFPCSGEINFKVADSKTSVECVLKHYARDNPILEYTDGVSADFGSWRFNLRSSNTEPLLRLNVESREDRALMESRLNEIITLMSM